MKISQWIDQVLIYEDDKLPKRLMVVTFFTGPILNGYLFHNPQLEVSTKLNLSVVIYISMLAFISSLLRLGFRKLPLPRVQFGFWGRILRDHTFWFLVLLLTLFYQYAFVYEPILHYERPRRFDVILVTTSAYAFFCAFISEHFRIDFERLKT